MSYYDKVAQIRELLERNLDSSEIAHRLCLDLNQVLQIIATSIT
jgi:transcription initiation factor IIE alpha subunit